LSALASPIDRLRELGGEIFWDGERVRYRIPANNPEARELIADLRQNRDAVAGMLRDQQSQAPSLDEVKANLPPGVRLIDYRPKETPFAVAPVSVVADAGKFYRAYLQDLRWRLQHPHAHAAPPLADILSKLAEAGLSLDVREGS
jgi:hypothetical protein